MREKLVPAIAVRLALSRIAALRVICAVPHAGSYAAASRAAIACHRATPVIHEVAVLADSQAFLTNTVGICPVRTAIELILSIPQGIPRGYATGIFANIRANQAGAALRGGFAAEASRLATTATAAPAAASDRRRPSARINSTASQRQEHPRDSRSDLQCSHLFLRSRHPARHDVRARMRESYFCLAD